MKELLYKLLLLVELLLKSVDRPQGDNPLESVAVAVKQLSPRQRTCLEKAKSLAKALLHYLEHPDLDRPKNFSYDYCLCLMLLSEGGLFD